MEKEKIILENKNLAEQVVRNRNIVEVSKTQDTSGVNFSTGTMSKEDLHQYRYPLFSGLFLREARLLKSQTFITTTLTSRSKVLPSS